MAVSSPNRNHPVADVNVADLERQARAGGDEAVGVEHPPAAVEERAHPATRGCRTSDDLAGVVDGPAPLKSPALISHPPANGSRMPHLLVLKASSSRRSPRPPEKVDPWQGEAEPAREPDLPVVGIPGLPGPISRPSPTRAVHRRCPRAEAVARKSSPAHERGLGAGRTGPRGPGTRRPGRPARRGPSSNATSRPRTPQGPSIFSEGRWV
jgi:hypothetical protein